MFVVTVKFTTSRADHAAFLALITRNAAQSLADEPGCARFDVATSPDRPGDFFLYELYTDAAAFEAHKSTPHFRAFDTASAPLVTGKSVALYHLEPMVPA
ncbi:MAG: antibiotic biosynthesis monooxygenase [Rhodobacter sp.]|nr:antibiotic biosynthesis monooxygenase [Rhodobacter sp.]